MQVCRGLEPLRSQPGYCEGMVVGGWLTELVLVEVVRCISTLRGGRFGLLRCVSRIRTSASGDEKSEDFFADATYLIVQPIDAGAAGAGAASPTVSRGASAGAAHLTGPSGEPQLLCLPGYIIEMKPLTRSLQAKNYLARVMAGDVGSVLSVVAMLLAFVVATVMRVPEAVFTALGSAVMATCAAHAGTPAAALAGDHDAIRSCATAFAVAAATISAIRIVIVSPRGPTPELRSHHDGSVLLEFALLPRVALKYPDLALKAAVASKDQARWTPPQRPCAKLRVDAAAAVVREAVRGVAAAGDRGTGCPALPALRLYQSAGVAVAHAIVRASGRVVLHAPTGVGKTLMLTTFALQLAGEGGRGAGSCSGRLRVGGVSGGGSGGWCCCDARGRSGGGGGRGGRGSAAAADHALYLQHGWEDACARRKSEVWPRGRRHEARRKGSQMISPLHM